MFYYKYNTSLIIYFIINIAMLGVQDDTEELITSFKGNFIESNYFFNYSSFLGKQLLLW